MIAIREAWQAGLLRREHWRANVLSGLVVGVVALPLAMAFAIASGARPEQGLYTAMVAGALVSLFGGSRVQIAGPTGAFVVILAGVTAEHGVAGLQLATLMAGAILMLLGVSRLGGVIRFIPAPVIVGFTAGIGVIIWVGQWRDFLGLPAVAGEHFHQKLWQLLQAVPQLHSTTTLLGLFSLALLLLAPRVPGLARVPAPLVALVAGTLAQAIWQFPGVATIGSAFGEIPRALPAPSLPEISIAQVISLIGPAFAIALLGAIESLLSAVVADGMTGQRHRPNQELLGQGLANLVAPLFGGFAATGAIARTATNVRNGGNSPLAGLVHVATLVLVVLVCAPLAADVPLCTLAAILFVVAYNMSDLGHVGYMLRHAPRADVLILLVTFLLTVLVDLVVAVNIGVVLAMLHFLRRMAASVEVREESGVAGAVEAPPGVLVYSIDGPLFFGAVENFERALARTHTDPALLVIRLGRVPFVDITGLQALQEVTRRFQRRGTRLMFCEANERVRRKLARAGLLEEAGCRNTLAEALADQASQGPLNTPHQADDGEAKPGEKTEFTGRK